MQFVRLAATPLVIIGVAANLVAQDDFGGSGGFGGGGLGSGEVIGTSPGTEARPVQDLTRDLRLLRQPHAGRTVSPQDTSAVAAPTETSVSRSQEISKLKSRLDEKANFDFFEVPLQEVVSWLKDALSVNIQCDIQALEEEGISPEDEPVTFNARNISYRAALNHLLAQLNLTWVVDEKLVTITSRDRAEETLHVNIYPVWDLVKSPFSDKAEDADVDTLIESITTTIAPHSWDDVGGPASISSLKGMLTVSQTRQLHEEVAQLLESLRKFPVEPTDAIQVISAGESDEKATILQRLRAVTELDFAEVPLEEVVESLVEELDVPVLLDNRALDDEGVSTDDPVSVQIAGINMGNALNLMLNDLNLTWIVEDEAVVVTSQEAAEETMNCRLYGVGPLIDAVRQPEMDSLGEEFDDLISNITLTISPSSWDQVGGPGSIVAYPSRSVLIVSNTDEVHEKMQRFLRMLTRGRQGENSSPKATRRPDDVGIKSYRLARRYRNLEASEAIVRQLEAFLEGSDNAINSSESRFFIRVVGDNLIVSHRRDAHTALRSVLKKLGVLDGTSSFGGSAGSEVMGSSGQGTFSGAMSGPMPAGMF